MTIDRLSRAASSDHSPCVGHCINDDAGFCLSCRRSSAEIAAWRDLDGDMLKAVWGRIPAEIDKIGVGVMRLPINPDDIAAIAEEVLNRGGRWALGISEHWVYGDNFIGNNGGVLSAVSADGKTTITLDLSGKMRGLIWARDGRNLTDGIDNLPILIVVPRARIKSSPNTAPTICDDGMLDLGLGFNSITALQDGDDMVIKSLLATAWIRGGASAGLNIIGKNGVLPKGLNLPESYVLGAVLLPKGEAALG